MCHDLDLAIADLRDVDRIAEVPHTALNLDPVMQELFEGRKVENLVADRLSTVDSVLEDGKVRNQ